MTSNKITSDQKMALVADEQSFYRMFKRDPEIMLLIDPVSGAILDANPVALDFYGYSKEKICSMLIEEINTLSPAQIAAERQKALHEERNYFVFPHKRANGDERIVEVYSSPIVLHEKNMLFSIIHDITKPKPSDTVIWMR